MTTRQLSGTAAIVTGGGTPPGPPVTGSKRLKGRTDLQRTRTLATAMRCGRIGNSW